MSVETLHYGQSRLIFDFEHRDHALIAGVGYGKTRIGPPWHWLRVLRNPKSKESIVIAPIYRLTRRCFNEYRDYLNRCGVKEGRYGGVTINKSDLTITRNRTGQVIYFLSGESPERLVSFTISHAWCDEAALMLRQVRKNLLKRLRCPKAFTLRQILSGTTPEGTGNWLYDVFGPEKVEREADAPFSVSDTKLVLHGSSYDNPYLDLEFLQGVLEEEFGFDPAYFANYVLGEFVSLSKDRFYFSFDQRFNVESRPIDPNNKRLVITWDNNVGKQAWSAIQKQGDTWAVVKSNRANGKNIDDCCNQIFETLPPFDFEDWHFEVTGDAALHNRSVQTHTTGYDVIKANLIKEYPNLQVTAYRANPGVEERSRRTNSLFAARKLIIDSSCSKVINSAKSCEQDGKGGIKKPKDDDITHAMEAVDHAMMKLQPLIIKRSGRTGITL